MKSSSRRVFLGGVGAVGCTAVGVALAERLGFAAALPRSARERLRFGRLDPLVDLIQSTPADELVPLVVQDLRRGTPLADVVGACALANARAFGGTNYDGYHALMALMPSLEMAAQMPAPYQPLPVLKVLHRNARCLQAEGASSEDALAPLADAAGAAGLVESMRARDLGRAELGLTAAAQARSPARAWEELQTVVRDDVDVHRVVLAWRAFDLLRVAGQEQSVTLLRQSVRFCIEEDGRRARRGEGPTELRALLPALLEKHGLRERERGDRRADDAQVERLAGVVFSAPRAEAAQAAAAALGEGVDPEDVGAAISLAATRLLLHDPGRASAAPGRPAGSVHGASVGVHASDAANAWRQLARAGSARNAFASLVAGAYHTAGQSGAVGAEAHDQDATPSTRSDPADLRDEIAGCIRARDQKGASRATRRYCELGHPHEALFAAFLPFAVSEDGALHAEKYFRTAQEEHASARKAYEPLYLVALSRVLASHHGHPAPGCEDARKLLAG